MYITSQAPSFDLIWAIVFLNQLGIQDYLAAVQLSYDGCHDEGEWGVDAVFDGIGEKSLKPSYEILRIGCRLVAYGPFSTTDTENWMMMFTLNLVPDTP